MHLRVLAVSQFLPCSERSAGDRRFVALLKMLARHREVDLYIEFDSPHLSPEQIEKSYDNLNKIGVRILGAGWRAFAKALAQTHYDVGFFEFYYTAERNAKEFRRRQPGAKVIIDSVDVHFAREFAGTKFGACEAGQAENTRRRELSVYRNADAVIVVTDEDERILRAEGEMPPLFILPIIMSQHPRVPGTRQPEVLFIGGFSHSPNVDGLIWFTHEIWPHVQMSVPNAKLTIIGSDVPVEIEALNAIPGIEVVGFVEDTTSCFDRAAVSVAPLRYGAGMKGKVVEAMAHGLPVVTTSVGAQGIKGVHGKHLFIADDPANFAEALKTLLNDPARGYRIGLESQKLIAAQCGPDSVELALANMLKDVVPYERSFANWVSWRLVNLQWASRYVIRNLRRAFRPHQKQTQTRHEHER